VAEVHQNLERNVWPGTVYGSLAQNPPPNAMIALRTAEEPLSFTRTVRERIFSLDRDQPTSDIQTMDQLVEAEAGQRRLMVILLESFSAVAVLLALTGIYGAISYSVTQRIPELGIRHALGAETTQIVMLVMRQGLKLALAGIVIGTAGAFVLSRVMKSLLYQISATDPATLAGVAILFLFIALAARYIPARRAARIDPVDALRSL
jgi:putative ABC transport system permease protein